MAFNRDGANAHRVNVYTHQTLRKLAKNGLIVYSGSLLKTIVGVSGDVVLDLAGPGDTIEGVSEQMRQYPIDNETTIRQELLYKPFVQDHTYKIKVKPGQTISNGDIGKYIMIDSDQYLDTATLSTTEGQFKVEGIFQSGKYAEVRILNEKDMQSLLDLHIVGVNSTSTPGEYEGEMSDGSTFPIDLTDLVNEPGHVPATINGNGIITSTASGTDSQTFQLGLNIGQLASADGNNQVVLGSDGKLFVAQTTISTSGFNAVATIADRDAQTVADGHITQVTNATDPNDNGFYIFDSATSSWTELVPNATVISVNGKTGSVVLIPSDLAYVATVNGNSVTDVQEALDELVAFVNAGEAHKALTLDTGNSSELTLDTVNQKIKLDLSGIKSDISDLDNRLTVVEGDITSINTQLTDHENRIDDLESDNVQADWQQTNNASPDFIKNKVVRPDQLGGTTTNSKIVVRDTNDKFRDATTADITALGFTQFSGGPVNGLDGISNDLIGQAKYRANYRGETLGDISSGGRGCWYDNIGQKIFISRDNQVAVYDTQWNELSTITVSGGGGFLQGNNATRSLYTFNGSQKINMDTLVVSGSIGGTLLDISPDGSVGISLTANTRASANGSLTITAFNTSNMSVINTFTKTNTASNLTASSNIIGGATLINNTEYVLAYQVFNSNGSIFVGFEKISIASASVVGTYTLSTNNLNYSPTSIQFSPATSNIYCIHGDNGIYNIYSLDLSLTTDTLVYQGSAGGGYPNSRALMKALYRTFDNSIGVCIYYPQQIGGGDVQGRYIFKNNTKTRTSFPQYFVPTGSGATSVLVQITAIY